jgi:hypothetical protein
MLRLLSSFLVLLLLNSAAQAVGLLKYVQIEVNAEATQMAPFSFNSTVAVGTPSRIIRNAKNSSENPVRMDYNVTSLGVTEDGQPAAVVVGVLYVGAKDTWTIVSEFNETLIIGGETASLNLTKSSGAQVSLNISVKPVTEQAVSSLLGGQTP